MREAILRDSYNQNYAFNVNAENIPPYNLVLNRDGDYLSRLSSQEGLALKTYQSDLLQNWIKSAYIDAIAAESSVDTSTGNFTIDQLNLAEKVYKLLNRIAISGGTYDDWLDTVWMTDRTLRAETPIYHGDQIRELAFQEVVSVSAAAAQGQPLGTLAGKGVMTGKHKQL